jgi:NADH dehydrogenase [ubiquinone] 1 alpha subcomplex assembly factor 5
MIAENMNPKLFDYAAQRRNRTRAVSSFDAFNFLKQEAALRLADRLELMRRDFPLALDFGCHDGVLTRQFRSTGKVGTIVQADPAPAFAATASADGPALAVEYDLLPFAPESFDAVFSCLTLHWIDDLPGVMIQLRRLLKPDGLFLINLFGGTTLTELRAVLLEAEQELYGGAGPRTAPMADIRDVGGLLGRAGLALPVADADRLTIEYPDLFRLMADLRGMGEQNAMLGRVRRPSSRRLFMRAAEIYQEKFGLANGRIPASFEIITLTGWAPHASQQQPLRPGSAAHRLADTLASEEMPLNETEFRETESDRGKPKT